ncbi:MAG: hypothetical protein FWD94_08050 [Treponema sp.]|nr:hypothetical protein [Treponema sp.]
MSGDEKVRAKYERREKAWRDRVSAMDASEKRGREQGLKETARNALAKGYSPEQVHDITGLDLETIARLASGG